MDLQATKLDLVQQLLNIQDVSILLRIKKVIKESRESEWNALPVHVREGIIEGVSQLKNGDSVSQDDLRKSIKDKFNF